jgi:hypothetical protein
MGVKGYRLWAMGQLDSTCRTPPLPPPDATMTTAAPLALCVALQVAFERQTLKPVFSLDRL